MTQEPIRVLLIEDNPADARLIGIMLAEANTLSFQFSWVDNLTEGIERIRSSEIDVVLLDLGLPDLDGVEVCRRIRRGDAHVPIVILTARHSEVDVVLGLDAGADDYVTKPFRLAELLARVRAHLRRSSAVAVSSAPAIQVGDVELDRDARRVRVDGDEVELRAREFDLLAFLMDHAGVAVTRERIMSEVWDEHWFGPTKTLDMHISALRRKLDDPADEPIRITTLRGVGYRFEQP